jgi:hypothetical protein
MIVQHRLPSALIEALVSAAPASQSDAMKRMTNVANLLDSAFIIPGSQQSLGIDAIIGLIPGLGDVATTALSSYIIWESRNLGVSRAALFRMLVNLAIHATIGAIPVIGDVFDAFFRVNQRNLRIVRNELTRAHS